MESQMKGQMQKAGDETAFRAAAQAAGFTAEADLAALLQATRLRRAPWRSGPLCAADFNL